MKIRRIFYSARFERSFIALDKNERKIIAERERIFKENCFDLRLKTHKLKGKLKQYWSFSITYSHRIMFEILDDGVVAFIDVGDHSLYK